MDDKELNKLHLQNISMLDRLWASMRDKEDELDNILNSGPKNKDEVLLVRSALCLILAEVNFKKAEQIRVEKGNL